MDELNRRNLMSAEKLLDKCRKLIDERDYLGAMDVCDEILKTDLNSQSANGYKAWCLYLLDRYDEALELLDNAIVLYPQNHHYLSIRADVFMCRSEYGKAIECFEKILEIGVSDQVELGFVKRNYETCLSLWADELIEHEKYVDAWKCYKRELELKSGETGRLELIKDFKKYVGRYVSKAKSRHYYVKVSSDDAKSKLIMFLNENGFDGSNTSESLFLIDVVVKSYESVSLKEVGSGNIISESKFYDKVNYYPRNRIERKKIFSDDNILLYEGYTLNGLPYGFGIAYFENGKVYREGIFDVKGIVQGKEYYPSGQLRFEGQWCITYGYGPNAPCNGNAYDENGEMIYSGKFEIKRGGVGWPMIQKPKGFAHEQKQRPKIEYYRGSY